MRSKKNVTNKYGKRIYYRVAVIGMAAALLCVRGYTGSYASSRERLCAAGQESGFVLDAQAATDSGEKQDGKEELQLYAQAAVLMDADSGRVLYGKNAEDKLPMASTTKIMTCILALEYGDLDQIVEASSYAASMPKVKLFVKAGEKYRLGDLLFS